MPTAVLKGALKMGGIRYPAGATIDNLTDAEYDALVASGVVVQEPASSLPRMRVPRSAEEKKAALEEAQKRVATTTGRGVPDGASQATGSPEKPADKPPTG